MFPSSKREDHSFENINVKLLRELSTVVVRVKKARKWSLVNPLTKAFVKACFIMKLQSVKSILLMKAIIKAVRELKQLISEEYLLVEMGVREAWKLSDLASNWGHKDAYKWRNNKSYIILQGLTLRWIAKLFNYLMSFQHSDTIS
jgi:hypothetical protein